MYRVPWTKFDNPNGWLEITTYCQLKCNGCYRGCDKNVNPEHVPLEKLIQDIDFYIENRNINMISLSGGEPLLYPDLNKLLSYCKEKGLKVRILSNGLLLNYRTLKQLENNGVSEFLLHVSKEQNYKGYDTEKKLNEIRLDYCNLFSEVEKIQLGFIMPITIDNFNEIENVLQFCKSHSNIVRSIAFTCYNGQANEMYDEYRKVSLKMIQKEISRIYNCEPSSFMGKRYNPDKPSWLWYFPLINKLGEVVGNISPKGVEQIQIYYKKKTGKWPFTLIKDKLRKKSLFLFLKLNNIHKWLFNDTYLQVISITDTPELEKEGWDTCEGCLDPVLYENKLVPSCLLERIKKGEDIRI